MPITYDIAFDNEEKVYYSGQTLAGHVNLTVRGLEPVVLEAFYIELTGKATCRWHNLSYDHFYNKDEVVLEKNIYFRENENLNLDPGTYTYNFECDLPATLPSSFEGEFGSIRYEATIVIRYEDLFDRTHSTTRFTVIKKLNLNDDIKLADPVVKQIEERFLYCCCLCCCESDPMEVMVRIPVSGYTPGQTINVEIKAVNHSNTDVADFWASLNRRVSYEIQGEEKKTHEEATVLTKECTTRCPRTMTRDFRLNLVVPPTPPTDTTNSKICKIEYFLNISGLTEGCHNDVIIDIPITIGTYPILDQANANVPSVSQSPNPNPRIYKPAVVSQQPTRSNGTNVEDIELKPSAPYPDEDPPTYEEAASTSEKTKNAFNPKYPVFRRATSYSSND